MIEKVAFYLQRNDEEPNILLAEDLAGRNDAAGIAEIAKGLDADEPQVAGDCVKVLYEIGYRKPELIAPYAATFVAGLKSRNNRIVWGSAIALSLIAESASDYLFSELETIRRAYESGSGIQDRSAGTMRYLGGVPAEKSREAAYKHERNRVVRDTRLCEE